ncbi:MAG: MFS transporter [Solidesulfovibrio sp.]|uniref:MFS transporter n=1 Tax=Solidesulfovibrio sp. TaxID=2910990 RepID=UPI00315983EE
MPAQLTDILDCAPLNAFHKKLLIYSSGGPFLDGYVLSIVGIALVQATPQLNLSLTWQGLIGASALIGIILGGFFGGVFTDKYGRHILYTIDLIAIGVSSIAQFWVESAMSLFVWRLILGISVGADYPIATSLLAEFTPKKYRGPFIGFILAMWFVGAAVAYVVGEWMLGIGPDGWRWMLASAALPTAIFMFMRRGTPESPRWLLKNGRYAEANSVLTMVCGKHDQVIDVDEESNAQNVGVSALFKAGYGPRMIFITIFWSCAIIPLFAVYAFCPTIFEALGLTERAGTSGSSVIMVLFLLGTVISLLVINKLGRRLLLLHSFFWSGLALLFLGIYHDSSPYVIMLFFSAYAIFTGGAQTLQFVYPNELFPTEIRASAVGLASSLSRFGAAIGTYLVPVAIADLGIGTTMIIAAAITGVGFLVSWKMAPETRHHSLEDAACLSKTVEI